MPRTPPTLTQILRKHRMRVAPPVIASPSASSHLCGPRVLHQDLKTDISHGFEGAQTVGHRDG